MRRRDVPGTARFLTFSCFQRLSLFDNDRIKDHFVHRLREATGTHGVFLLAWVIMPEHLHLIVFTEDEERIPAFLRTLKRPFARKVLDRWRALRAPILPRLTDGSGETHFWQAGGGYDRNVVGGELIEKIQYIHRNPITRRLVDHSVDWKWSSAAAYAGVTDSEMPAIAFGLLPNYSGELI
jgi:putative transposase